MKLDPDYPVQTARLRLRPLSTADTEDLLAYRGMTEVCRFVPFEPMDRNTVADRLNAGWARTSITAEGQGLKLGVERLDTRRLIGDVMLWLQSTEHRGGEIGWVFHPAVSGRGYATEASHAMLHLAFDQLELHRVTARIDARNHASLRLADRLGMRREAHLIANEWFKGEWSDEIDYALLEDEFAAQHREGPHACQWPLAQSTAAGVPQPITGYVGAMADFTDTITVDADPAALFEYLSDVRNLPHYFHRMTSAEPGDGDEVRTTARLPDGREVQGDAWFSVDRERQHLQWGSEGASEYHGHLDVRRATAGSEVEVHLHTTRVSPEDSEVRHGIAQTLANIKQQVESSR